MASALLKFTQGFNVADGQALYGQFALPVLVENSDDTGVLTWLFELVEIPPGSALTLGDSSTSDSYSFTPDVGGCYRFRLTVTPEGDGTVDIRNVIVPFPRRNTVVPPYQGFPAPLPLPQTGDPNAKPDEMNAFDQARGWMGDRNLTAVYASLRLCDNVGWPPTSQAWVDAQTIADEDLRNGSMEMPFATCVDGMNVINLDTGGVIHLIPGEDHSGETVDFGPGDLVFVGPGRQPIIPPGINFIAVGNVHFSDANVTSSIGGELGNVFADRTQLDTIFSCGVFQGRSCVVNGSVTSVAAPTFTDCDIAGNIETEDTTVTVLRSRFTAGTSITFTDAPGNVIVDEQTLRTMIAQGVTVSNGTTTLAPQDGSVWTSYAPEFEGVAVGSTGSSDSWYRFVGDTCHTRHQFIFQGSEPSLTTLFIPLPLGLIVDETKLPSFTTAIVAGRGSGDSPTTVPNLIAEWTGDPDNGLTLDDGFGGDFLLLLPVRLSILLDMPFKLPAG